MRASSIETTHHVPSRTRTPPSGCFEKSPSRRTTCFRVLLARSKITLFLGRNPNKTCEPEPLQSSACYLGFTPDPKKSELGNAERVWIHRAEPTIEEDTNASSTLVVCSFDSRQNRPRRCGVVPTRSAICKIGVSSQSSFWFQRRRARLTA